MRKLTLLMLALLVNSAQAQYFSSPFNTGSDGTVIFPEGVYPFEEGDEVAAVSPRGTIGGAIQWQARGSHVLTVWGDNSMTEAVDGFLEGERLFYAWWDGEIERTFTTTYLPGMARSIDGLYRTNVLYVVGSVTAEAQDTTLQGEWLEAAIGTQGSAMATESGTTVNASGGDIFGTSDEFYYVYQPIGDGTITAKILSQTRTDAWAKAGVMVRESLDPGARNVFVALTADKVRLHQQRSSDRTLYETFGKSTYPQYVKITRLGDVITGGFSQDGLTWVMADTVRLDMQSAYVGLAATAHNRSTMSTAIFEDVKIDLPPGPESTPDPIPEPTPDPEPIPDPEPTPDPLPDPEPTQIEVLARIEALLQEILDLIERL